MQPSRIGLNTGVSIVATLYGLVIILFVCGGGAVALSAGLSAIGCLPSATGVQEHTRSSESPKKVIAA